MLDSVFRTSEFEVFVSMLEENTPDKNVTITTKPIGRPGVEETKGVIPFTLLLDVIKHLGKIYNIDYREEHKSDLNRFSPGTEVPMVIAVGQNGNCVGCNKQTEEP